MQETLNLRSGTTPTSAPTPAPTKPRAPERLSISLPQTPTNFPTLSSTPPPPLQPRTWVNLDLHHHLSPADNTNTNNEFQDKILFLDSQGLDPLTNLPPSAIHASSSLSDLKAVFDYLSSLGFSPPDLRRAISMCPLILSFNLRHIASVFSFLLREALVPSSSLRHVIRRRPRLLISDVDTRLRPTMYFLQSIGIHQVHKHTDLLSSSVEDKYLPKIHFFQNIGFTYRESVFMFRKFPALFCYSVKDNFEPKFNYFVVEMGRDLKELMDFPQYFSFSLEKRIKPRHQSCVESGVCFPLPLLLKMKDDKFRERLETCSDSSLPRSNSPLWSADINTSLL